MVKRPVRNGVEKNIAARRKIRKIKTRIGRAQLLKDLERYRTLALELGASDAKVISADQIMIDERAAIKCAYPKCKYYGTNAHCPPHAIGPETMRQVIRLYRFAVFYTIKGFSRSCSFRDDERIGDKYFPENVANLRYAITGGIESRAFYDGYYFALGFGGSACKKDFCPEKNCAVLNREPCRAPLVARSSMEAVGMDAFGMAVKVGWDIYPIGKGISVREVPYGRGLGLILID